MILNTSWLKTSIWENIANFASDKSQLTCKVNESEIAVWPGESEYEPLLELEVSDQAALVEISHGRHIRGWYPGGRFVDGRFIKGSWFDDWSRFLQGKWLEPRFIEGKQDYGQFFEGEWVNDANFVEGKWVDGKLVKGFWANWRESKFFEGTWRDGIFVKGKWNKEEFIEGKWIGQRFYVGTWKSNGTITQESRATQPKIADLCPLKGWWSKVSKKDDTEVDDAEGYEIDSYEDEVYDTD